MYQRDEPQVGVAVGESVLFQLHFGIADESGQACAQLPGSAVVECFIYIIYFICFFNKNSYLYSIKYEMALQN